MLTLKRFSATLVEQNVCQRLKRFAVVADSLCAKRPKGVEVRIKTRQNTFRFTVKSRFANAAFRDNFRAILMGSKT
jgi:hypothetical protein